MFTRYVLEINNCKYESTHETLESAALAFSALENVIGDVAHLIEITSHDYTTLVSAVSMLEGMYSTRRMVGRKAWAEIRDDHFESVYFRPIGVCGLVNALIQRIEEQADRINSLESQKDSI